MRSVVTFLTGFMAGMLFLLALLWSQPGHSFFSLWAELDLILAHLAHADLGIHGAIKGKAKNNVDDERQPPAFVAGFDVFESLGWR